MNVSVWIAGLSLLVTFSIFLATVIYKTGHTAARVEELEKWRANMRHDMHEISDKLEFIANELRGLHTIIEERTERRHHPRFPTGSDRVGD